ncbi:major coat protein [Collimonas sp. NPDC087041]|uniref:major coat protein n=1 Tax=Collimonas sp. NPDC087041 TaxID=3363960 RepID=UPI00382F1CE6
MKPISKIHARVLKIAAPAVALLAAGAARADATLDPSVAAAFTSMQANATAVFGLAMPVVASILGMVIVIKLVKRFGNKV